MAMILACARRPALRGASGRRRRAERASRAIYESVLEATAAGVRTPDLGGHARHDRVHDGRRGARAHEDRRLVLARDRRSSRLATAAARRSRRPPRAWQAPYSSAISRGCKPHCSSSRRRSYLYEHMFPLFSISCATPRSATPTWRLALLTLDAVRLPDRLFAPGRSRRLLRRAQGARGTVTASPGATQRTGARDRRSAAPPARCAR